MTKKIANQVRVTSQYDAFTTAGENRGIVQSHVRKLAHSMSNHGWIDSFPMMVVQRGDKLEIRDGQNRFAAAKQLGIPVKYVLTQNGQGEIPISELNKYQKTWTALDYCKSFANQGDQDYLTLVKFMEEESLPLTPAAALLSMGTVSSRALKNGAFGVVDVGWARLISAHLRYLRDVMLWSPLNTNFVRVFVKACMVDGFDPDLFSRKVEQNPDKVKKMATEPGIASMMEDVYNHRNRDPIPLAYEISRISATNRKMTPSKRKARQK